MLIDELSPSELHTRLRSEDVPLPRFSSDELYAVAPHAPCWELLPKPELSELPPGEQRAVATSAIRSLVARGYASPGSPGAEGRSLELRGALAFAHSIRSAPASIGVLTGPRGHVSFLWGTDRGANVLVERVVDEVHSLTLVAVDRLAAGIARDLCGRVPDGDGVVRPLDLASDEGVRLETELADGRERSTLEMSYQSGPPWRGHLTIVNREDDVVLLSAAPHEDPDLREVSAVSTGRLGVASVLSVWLRPESVVGKEDR